ncbi:MAG TPA: DsbA family protein [Caldilineaceae bacterium]|nr:DsbA family protein [Caldilineaceae bacterium]
MTTSASRKGRTGRKAGSSSLNYWLIGAGVFFIALIGLVIWANNRPSGTPASKVDLPADWVTGMSMGDPAAKVVVQAWEDFLCPHCQDWTATVEPKLVDEYVKTGKIRFEYHPLPLQGFQPASGMAAHSAFCAADQNSFWPYHDLLFATAASRGQAGFSLDVLVQNAKELGLDTAQFQQCMTSQQHSADVEASLAEASQLGLSSTPSLLINGKRMGNPFDYATIQAEIDQLVGAAQ